MTFDNYLDILDISGLLILTKYRIYPKALLNMVCDSLSISLSSLEGVVIINYGTPGAIVTLIKV